MPNETQPHLNVNGETLTIDDAWLGESLLYTLRERLGLYGSKNACEQGECGSCSIMLDETLVCACFEKHPPPLICSELVLAFVSSYTVMTESHGFRF